MPRETNDKRVETLELRMSDLEALPARMTALEGQILQLRDEMHGEFSAVRAEMRTLNESTLAVIKSGDEETRVYMRLLFEKHEADRRLVAEGRPKRKKT